MNDGLIQALHKAEFEVAVELNGARTVPAGVDWICVSPKIGTLLKQRSGNRRPLSWADVARLLGMSRQAIQNLASNRDPKATNTRFLEAFCRFFHCQPGELVELAPPLGDGIDHDEVDRLLTVVPGERCPYHVEELYGDEANRRWAEDRAMLDPPPA